jgi:hypothetical protein
VIRLWDNAWVAEFIPFLDHDVEIRTSISTNAIESLNARYPRATTARGHFPREQAALKMSLPRYPIMGPHRRRDRLMETAGNTVSEIDPLTPTIANERQSRRREGDSPPRSESRVPQLVG